MIGALLEMLDVLLVAEQCPAFSAKNIRVGLEPDRIKFLTKLVPAQIGIVFIIHFKL